MTETTNRVPIPNGIRSELLRYYASQQTSQSARLVGFSIAIFTLMQLVQHSQEEPLSGIFSNLPVLLRLSESELILAETFEFAILFFSVTIIMFWVIRTIFRFTLFAYLGHRLIELRQVEVSTQDEEPDYLTVHEAVNNLVATKKVYFKVPLVWFIPRGEISQQWKGSLFSLFFGIVTTVILLWFLW